MTAHGRFLVGVLVVPAMALVLPVAASAQVHFTGPTNYVVGNEANSVAVGDFNGDADPDLAVANEVAVDVSVLLGRAGGSFRAATNVTVGAPTVSVAVGDFDDDTDPDLAIAYRLSNKVAVLLNTPKARCRGGRPRSSGQPARTCSAAPPGQM